MPRRPPEAWRRPHASGRRLAPWPLPRPPTTSASPRIGPPAHSHRPRTPPSGSRRPSEDLSARWCFSVTHMATRRHWISRPPPASATERAPLQVQTSWRTLRNEAHRLVRLGAPPEWRDRQQMRSTPSVTDFFRSALPAQTKYGKSTISYATPKRKLGPRDYHLIYASIPISGARGEST
jgi:hypothetical protein